MSELTLRIWDPTVHGLPKSFEELVDLSEKLEELEAKPSDQMIDFAQCVQEHALQNPENFGLYTSMSEKMFRQEYALFSITLPSTGWENVLVYLVETADHFNLVTLAEDLLMGFLPGGLVFPDSKYEQWKELKNYTSDDNPESPRTLKQFRAIIEPINVRLLTTQGLAIDKIDSSELIPVYSRDAIALNGKQSVYLSYIDDPQDFSINFGIRIYSSLVHEIYSKFNFSSVCADIFSIKLSQIISHPDWYKGLDLKRKTSELQELLKTVVFPLINSTTDIYGLDKAMNQDQSKIGRHFRRSFYIPHCAIVARLANNSCFDNLIVELEAAKQFSGANGKAMYSGEFNKLIQYLREEVKPLN